MKIKERKLIVINRYSRPEMANIWSENKYRAWRWKSWLTKWAGLEIPKEDVALIREKADFDIDHYFRDWARRRAWCGKLSRVRFLKQRRRAQVDPLWFWLLPTWWMLPTIYLYKQITTSSVVTLKTSPSSLIRLRHKFTIMMGRTHVCMRNLAPEVSSLRLGTAKWSAISSVRACSCWRGSW